ncbi:MAG: ABC transporter ATP-binding protein [Lentisphaeria bacterium]|nr:ABC transporter ATP-binding protein [Lentisphaeria bacterium]
MADKNIVTLKKVHHGYLIGKNKVEVLHGVDFEFPEDKWCCILGASGSGKTTLLNLIGSLEKCDSGTIEVDGRDLSKMSRRESAVFRAASIGFIFQSYCLLPELSIRENVMIAARLNGLSAGDAAEKADFLLEKVGLSHRRHHRPAELSGGEQQRSAVARALVNDPHLLLADEPTGNLDEETGNAIMELFCALRSERQKPLSIIMITHNRELCRFADLTAELSGGKLNYKN